jgi:S1-C subfamily serine protease
MRVIALLAVATMASPAVAQVTIMRAPGGFGANVIRAGLEMPRAVIGVTTTSAATNRDTLGVLVSAVQPGSPAEKAGIEEGNRIISVNGVSLKLAAADVGEYEVAGSMSRRLTRELDKLKPGDEVDLRVYANGQTKTVKVRTIAPDSLYESPIRRRTTDRATLGLNVALTGSARDSIGVFVMSVEDNSPAAKAGIEEGARLASINGVDLRARRTEPDEDMMSRASNVSRLERELAKVKPGDDVDLRVFYNGQYRSVKVKAVSQADLPRKGRATFIYGGDGMINLPPMPALPAIAPTLERLSIEAPRINNELRRALPRVIGLNRVVW